jgi:zinc transporter ZupT
MPHADGPLHAAEHAAHAGAHAANLAPAAGWSGLWPALAMSLLAMLSLWAGAALPTWASLRSRGFEGRLALLIGFSAGLMLATALHDLLPEALELNASRAMTGVAIGFLTLYLVERATHFHACRHRHCEIEPGGEDDEGLSHETHSGHAHGATGHSGHAHAGGRGHADTMALAGMSVHNFADGLTTAVAFGVSAAAGLTVVLAIVLHQAAAGLSLGAIMLRAGRARQRVLLSTLGAAAFIPLGVLFYFLAVPLGAPAQGLVLGVAGGSFLYVAACDLLPEAHAQDEGWAITAATICGYAFTLLARAVLPHGH